MNRFKTLDDIRFFAETNNIPLEKARFAIGEDKTEKRWFGIYQNSNGEWIVYKNKDDGTRFIRYRGFDEAEACKILADKLKSEIRLRKSKKTAKKTDKKEIHKIFLIVIATLSAIFLISSLLLRFVSNISKNNGYYHHNDTYYYKDNLKWYYYDEYKGNWVRDKCKNHDIEFYDDYEDYYRGTYYYDSYNTGDFEDTDYYRDNHNSSYDDDDDYDYSWDSNDSWDSYDTDWGSDW